MVRAVIGLMQTSSPPTALQSLEYRGRFAPSPTGPLHAGSLVAALASWLDARAHGGAWLVRIEDLDPPREVPGAARDILLTLAQFGMESDEAVAYQSERTTLYEAAFGRLRDHGLRVRLRLHALRDRRRGRRRRPGARHLSRHLPSRHRRTRDPGVALQGRGRRVLQRPGRWPAVAGPRSGSRRFRRAARRSDCGHISWQSSSTTAHSASPMSCVAPT